MSQVPDIFAGDAVVFRSELSIAEVTMIKPLPYLRVSQISKHLYVVCKIQPPSTLSNLRMPKTIKLLITTNKRLTQEITVTLPMQSETASRWTASAGPLLRQPLPVVEEVVPSSSLILKSGPN